MLALNERLHMIRFRAIFRYAFITVCFLLFADSGQAAPPSPSLGQIRELKPLSEGRFLLVMKKNSGETSVVVTTETLIRIAVPAEQLKQGDQIWAPPEEKKPAEEAAKPKKGAGQIPPPPAAKPKQPPMQGPPQPPGPPPADLPQPPQAPPQPPGKPDAQQPPPAPPVPPGQEQPPGGAVDQGAPPPPGAPAPEAEQKQKKKPAAEDAVEAPPDSLSPQLNPLSPANEKEEGGDQSGKQSGKEGPALVPMKVVGLEKTDEGILLELQTEEGSVKKQAFPQGASLLKLSGVDSLQKGMFASVQVGKEEEGHPVAEKITAVNRDKPAGKSSGKARSRQPAAAKPTEGRNT